MGARHAVVRTVKQARCRKHMRALCPVFSITIDGSSVALPRYRHVSAKGSVAKFTLYSVEAKARYADPDLTREEVPMDLAQGARKDLVSRRQALVLLGAAAAVRSADAAQQAIMQPVSLDHVNIRVSNVARTAEFYMGLFETPVLRNAALRAQPASPPSEGFFLKFGDGYLAISQAFAPDRPDLDHYSVGLRDYEKTRLTARLQDNGIAVPPRSSTDVWLADLDGALMQLRQPGGWARQTATPYQGPARGSPVLSPLSMSRIGLRSADVGRAGDF